MVPLRITARLHSSQVLQQQTAKSKVYIDIFTISGTKHYMNNGRIGNVTPLKNTSNNNKYSNSKWNGRAFVLMSNRRRACIYDP